MEWLLQVSGPTGYSSANPCAAQSGDGTVRVVARGSRSRLQGAHQSVVASPSHGLHDALRPSGRALGD